MTTIIVPGRLVSPTCIELAHPVSLNDGEIEVEIRQPHSGRQQAALLLLQLLAASPSRGRTKEDIDEQIREERESWERKEFRS
jgi:hypothetical protein